MSCLIYKCGHEKNSQSPLLFHSVILQINIINIKEGFCLPIVWNVPVNQIQTHLYMYFFFLVFFTKKTSSWHTAQMEFSKIKNPCQTTSTNKTSIVSQIVYLYTIVEHWVLTLIGFPIIVSCIREFLIWDTAHYNNYDSRRKF